MGYWGPLLSELYWAHPGNVAGINLVNLVCVICNLIHFMNRRLLARSWAVSHRSAGAQQRLFPTTMAVLAHLRTPSPYPYSNPIGLDMESVVMYMWYTCGRLRAHICFYVYTLYTTLWDSFFVVPSCNCTQFRGLGTYSCL